MSKSILVTDTIFVDDEDEQKIRAAGYSIKRIENPTMTESQLIEAVNDIEGYILGGIEKVTAAVIHAAPKLRAIAFCGTGFQTYIPGWLEAKARGIMISNVPGKNALAVAEYGLTLSLMMIREVLSLGRTGQKTFATTK